MDVDPLGADIGARIRARRRECGMTGKALAAKLSVPSTTVTAWERGRVLPGARSLLLLGRALDTPAATFLVDPDINAHELATRVSRLSPRLLPDLVRFLTLLEESDRAREILLSAIKQQHSPGPERLQDAYALEPVLEPRSGTRVPQRMAVQTAEDAPRPKRGRRVSTESMSPRVRKP